MLLMRAKMSKIELSNRPVSLVIIETCLLVAIALAALLGNVSVLNVFYKTPRLRTVTSYYIITLAIADILMAVMVMPGTILSAACGRDVLGPSLGKVGLFFFTAFIFGSLQTTSLIALNRYYCVVKPAKYRVYFKPKFAVLMIFGCWLITTCLTILLFTTGLEFAFFPGRYMYFLLPNKDTTKTLAGLYQIAFTIFPATLASICYWKIYRKIKIHNASTASSLNASNPASSSSPSVEELRLTKSLMAIVVGFILCWIPNSTLLNIAEYIDLPRGLELAIVICAFLSSAINPVLYNLFNKPFRRRLLELMHRICLTTNENNASTNQE